MIIPTYHQGSVKTTSRKEMAKRFSKPYHYTVNRKGWICHYVSDSPAFAVAEAWLHAVTSTQSPPSSWCLIEPIHDNHVFFLWVLDGVVQEAKTCTTSSIEPVIVQRCLQVYITDERLINHLPAATKDVKTLEPLTEDALKPFALKTGKPIDLHWLVLGGVVLMGLLASIMVQRSTSKNPPPVDPYIAYRLALNTATDASPAINAGVALGAYAVLLPDGWTLISIDLHGKAMVLSASRQASGERPVINAWVKQHASITAYSSVTLDTLRISLPLTASLNGWNNDIVSIEPTTTNIMDTFVSLGWTVSPPILGQGRISKDATFIVKKQGLYLHELQSIAKAIKDLPLSLIALQMKPTSENGLFHLSLTLRFIGATS